MFTLGDPSTTESTATYTWVVDDGPIVPVRYSSAGSVMKVEEIQVFINQYMDGEPEIDVRVRGWRCKRDGSEIGRRFHSWETADRVAASYFYAAGEQWAARKIKP